MEDKRFNPEKANMLMSTDRKKLLPPDQIIAHLDILPDDIIADLGAKWLFRHPNGQKSKGGLCS